jgi:hypothetical protein
LHTVRQTALFVRELLDATEPGATEAVLTAWARGHARPCRPGLRATRGVVETLTLDITTIRRSAGRLESCLVAYSERPGGPFRADAVSLSISRTE